jgi:hypothetical protein
MKRKSAAERDHPKAYDNSVFARGGNITSLGIGASVELPYGRLEPLDGVVELFQGHAIMAGSTELSLQVSIRRTSISGTRRYLSVKPQPAVVQFLSKLTAPASRNAVVASHLHRPISLAQLQNNVAITLRQCL